jgi:hypothetical protein
MDDASHKITVKLPNGAEFFAEGTEASVKESFASFLEALKSNGASTGPLRLEQFAGTAEPEPRTGDVSSGPAVYLDAAVLERLFRMEPNGDVTLTALPRGPQKEVDALLGLLFGFATLRHQTAVSATRLMRAAKQSGVQPARLDRVLARQGQFITESGTGKGKRYGLNNPGRRRAEEILAGILG